MFCESARGYGVHSVSQRVIYPLERRNGLLFVRVSVGTGVTPPVVARLLVDTGSSYTVLSTQILVRSGCEIPRSPRLISIMAAIGILSLPMVYDRTSVIGGFVM
jgi:hypothetical protein